MQKFINDSKNIPSYTEVGECGSKKTDRGLIVIIDLPEGISPCSGCRSSRECNVIRKPKPDDKFQPGFNQWFSYHEHEVQSCFACGRSDQGNESIGHHDEEHDGLLLEQRGFGQSDLPG